MVKCAGQCEFFRGRGVGKAEVRDAVVLMGKKQKINCRKKCGSRGNLREYKMQDVIATIVRVTLKYGTDGPASNR